MKGQSTYPFTMIEAGLTFFLIVGVLTGSYYHTEGFIGGETLTLIETRAEFAALAVYSFPEGGTELSTSEMEIEESPQPTLHYRGVNETLSPIYLPPEKTESVSHKTEFTNLCIDREEDRVKFDPGGC